MDGRVESDFERMNNRVLPNDLVVGIIIHDDSDVDECIICRCEDAVIPIL